MTRGPFTAVLADMDGVITDTAVLHERAWTRMFQDYLGKLSDQSPGDYGTFTSADYRDHVDGKPRYDGVRDFLAARQIQLPYGNPSDDPDVDSICGLGNRKNRYFMELLESEGAKVFDDAVVALERWRRGGLRLAVISSSRNCRRVLESVQLLEHVDTVVDGQVATALNLRGKHDILLEASRRLAVDPADAVVIEDATAGIRAARRAGFGLAIGVSRNGNEENLVEAGASQVVRRVDFASFPRRIPLALEHLDDLSRWRNSRPLALFLDHDGTLAPIVNDPEQAYMSESMRSIVEALAQHWLVAVISGRDRQDIVRRVAIDHILYAGNHGLDCVGRGQQKILPEAEAALGDVDMAEQTLREQLQAFSGVIIERKRFSVAVHYRQVEQESTIEKIIHIVESVCAKTSLRKRSGKKVVELEAAVDWNKGHALQWMTGTMDVKAGDYFPIYLGDDDTDEDAFKALQGNGPGIHVGEPVSDSLADYCLTSIDEVHRLLQWLSLQ